MTDGVHSRLKVVACNANGTGRQRYELSKQLQDLHIDVAPLSETYMRPHERFFIPNYHLNPTDCFQGRKGRTTIAVRKGIIQNHVDWPTFVSVEATGVCTSIANL
jgi:hypothetical protein